MGFWGFGVLGPARRQTVQDDPAGFDAQAPAHLGQHEPPDRFAGTGGFRLQVARQRGSEVGFRHPRSERSESARESDTGASQERNCFVGWPFEGRMRSAQVASSEVAHFSSRGTLRRVLSCSSG